MVFLKLIRFPNLLIVAFTQYLLQYLVLVPSLRRSDFSPILDDFHFFLLVFTTVIIAANGYIINDLKDYEIDILNKPEKVIINQKISFSTAKVLYLGLTILGFFISFYLANHVGNLWLVLIYPTAASLLFLYSNSLKKSVLWGNIIVSLFCAMVPGVVLFADRETVRQLDYQGFSYGIGLIEIFSFYLIFAFLSTLFREIIKDIEDVEGDRKNNCRTLPIVAGIKTAKGVAILVGLILIFFLYQWYIYEVKFINIDFRKLYLVLAIILPLVATMIYISFANSKKEFHQLSQVSKYIMLSGLLYLIIISL